MLDFLGMIKFFDEHKVSFVSVTQDLNTDTAMGRLVLNVLQSFAQFEREIASERIKDKIAAMMRLRANCTSIMTKQRSYGFCLRVLLRHPRRPTQSKRQRKLDIKAKPEGQETVSITPHGILPSRLYTKSSAINFTSARLNIKKKVNPMTDYMMPSSPRIFLIRLKRY